MASKVILIKPSGITKGFNTIQSAIDGAIAGETVVIYNSTYNEQIIIKDGVNIFCLPGVTIASDNPLGTIIDNGIQANVVLEGNPTILNTGGGSRINLTNINSVVDESNEFTNLQVSGSLIVTGSLLIDKNLSIGTSDVSSSILNIYTDSFNGNNVINVSNVNSPIFSVTKAGNVGIGIVNGNKMRLVVAGGIQIGGNDAISGSEIYGGLIVGKSNDVNRLTGQAFDAGAKSWIYNERALSNSYGYPIYTLGSIRADGNMYTSGYLYAGSNTLFIGTVTQSNSTFDETINIKRAYYVITNTAPQTQIIDFRNNYVYNYKLSVSAFATTNSGSAGFEISGVYYKNGTASAFVSDPNIICVAQTLNFTGSISADVNGNGDFVLTVIGNDNSAIRWGIFNDSTGVKIN